MGPVKKRLVIGFVISAMNTVGRVLLILHTLWSETDFA